MKKLATLTALALTIATSSAFAETLTGYVADTMCSKVPHKVSSASHADCAKKCIGMGDKPVLVVDEKIVYTVTNPDMLVKHAGEKVPVAGTVKDGALTVTSVK